MTSPRSPLLAALPGRIRVVRCLVEGHREVVAEARLGDTPVAVRAVRDAGAGALRELVALARLDVPGVAGIVEHGPLAGGGLWVARQWIDGVDLGHFALGAEPEAVGRSIASAARALHGVHLGGVVHGDLSPGNVLVGPDGAGWLTDFGLAVSGGAGDRALGTPPFIAPELLVGARPTPASDVFALGAVAALLLSRGEVDVRAFYGRFPAEPFLDAAGLEIETLPEWSRAAILTCVARAANERPGSALAFAREFEAALGIGPARSATGDGRVVLPPLDHLAGRRGVTDEIASLGPGLSTIEARDRGEAAGIAGSAALDLLGRGRRAALVDLQKLAARASTTLALDRAVAAQGRAVAGTLDAPGVLLVLAAGADPWQLSCLAALANAAADAGRVRLVLVQDGGLAPGSASLPPAWHSATAVALPPFGAQAIEAELERWLDAPGADAVARRRVLADRIDLVASGSSGEAVAALDRVRALGGLRSDEDSTWLAPAFPIESLAGSARAALPPSLGPDERAVLAAVALRPDGQPTETLAAVAGLAAHETRRILDALSSEGLVRRGGADVAWPCLAAANIAALDLGVESIRAIYGRLADVLTEERAPAEQTWASALASGRATAGDVLSTIEDLVRHGHHERVHAGLAAATVGLESIGRPLPPELVRQHALAAVRSGDPRTARRVLARSSNTLVATEIEATIASVEGRRDEAAELFDAARCPDRARVERAHAAFERGDLEALDRALAEAGEGAAPTGIDAESAAVDLVGLVALGALRRGDGDRARSLLIDALERARRADVPLFEAAILVNVATVARRTGRLDEAREALEDARSLYRSAGNAAGEAQTQSLLGGVLREIGDLAAAEGPLASALARRARSGDRVLAATSRGTLALLRLERGHLRAASSDLEAARHVLDEAGRTEHAELLAAALDVASARLGHDPASTAAPGAGQRVVELRSQAACLRGDAHDSKPPHDDDAHWIATSIDPTETRDRASAALERGADARAARLALAAYALSAAANDHETQQSARRIAQAALPRCMEGLTPDEERAAMRTLLGLPDPRPEQLDAWRLEPEDDMDVMTILELNERLVREEDTGPLLGAIVESALEVSGAERGFLVLEERGELILDTAFDSSRGEVSDEDVEWSRSIVTEALTSGRTTRIGDAIEDADLGAARSIESLGLRSVLAAPFTVSSDVRGVVVVDDRSRPGAFGPREERLLSLLAGQAALALRQVRRLEENRRLNVELGERMVQRETQLAEATRALADVGVAAPIQGLVGESEPMQRVRSLIHRVADAQLPVLLTGPSGSGKEVAARAVHAASPRSDGPFVSENCAALPPSLVESELFGAKRGSYTGAEQDRAGLFERAEGGTLFLDEIGELPVDVQAKLLRVLETRCVRRIGEEVERPVDFRLVSATNRDLPTRVEEGAFRSDLMYRLDGVTILMPSLDERRGDIPLLADHFLRLEAARSGELRRISPEVMRRLTDRTWPGNVRELSNEIGRLLLLSDGDVVDPDLVRTPATGLDAGAATGERSFRTIAQLEKEAIMDALERTNGDKREAAELLGISRAKVYQRLKEWGLT